MSRQLKELRSLMPWTWDARIDEHPAGKSSLRDFKDVYSWTGDEKSRRSNASPRVAGAAPLPRKWPPKAERTSTASGSPPQSTPCSKQVVGTAIEQTPNTRNSAASSGGHLSVPKATPAAGLRSSGRSGKRIDPASPLLDVVTPAPRLKVLSDQPDSAISTGERLQLQPRSTALMRTTAAPDAAIWGLARRTDTVVATAAVHSPICQPPSAAAQQAAGSTLMPDASGASPAEDPVAHPTSPVKPFEAKLAEVQQPKGLPAQPERPAQRKQRQGAAAEPPLTAPLQAEQPEPLEHAATDEAEESLAAATLLELPRQALVRPTSSTQMQRQPLRELAHNSQRGDGSAGAAQPKPQLLTKQQRKTGLLDAAWAAAGIAKRPPQQKRSARRPPPGARVTSPQLLSQFPCRQQFSTLPAAVVHQTGNVSSAPVADGVGGTIPSSGPPAPHVISPPPPVAVPSVSAPPPALPELPPIAPLILQPLRLQLAAEVPSLPVAHSDSSIALQVPQQMGVRPMQQSSMTSQSASTQQAHGAQTVGSLAPPSSSVPVKRPGDPLDFAHACKLLRWMDELQAE